MSDLLPSPLLAARNLRIGFDVAGAYREVLHGVDFTLQPGRCLALVGESGSGKSVIAKSLVGLLGDAARVSADQLEFQGHNLLALSQAHWRSVRGERVGFVLQDALVSLDPLRTVGEEVGDAFRLHRRAMPAAERRQQVLETLARVGIPDPEQRIDLRSPQLSGGLRQRALIASAIALEPALLIADEPTTALDASVQAQILALLLALKQRGTAILLISHDLAAVAKVADHIAVMHQGKIVEYAPSAQLRSAPVSPYTRQLLAAIPHPQRKGQRLSPGPALALPAHALAAIARPAAEALRGPRLEVRNVSKTFHRHPAQPRRAVDNVSFQVPAGATLGIVGESGSGKSTLANIVLGLLTPDAGQVDLDGHAWVARQQREAQRRPLRPRMGVVFQDPLSSFDPRWSVAQVLEDALLFGARKRGPTVTAQAHSLLDAVGLPRSALHSHPRYLSGGQRQRIAIARALAHSPSLVVCDEAVSALDVSIQAQILDLLLLIQRELHVSYLFISHDLDVVHHMSQQVVVMKDGAIVEHGEADQVLFHPSHDYTRQLLAASRANGVSP
ncbi:dipeptide ABC transporter ATP-binding protein [Pseudomonas typographi]|uniref:ABC transporter ATP-binding protein n=1 Tax=Pseudomonas typographi TaxID=2715964 RepID=A0ABR7YWW3_9PSED|nr:ABC transporter ATP-binding protein [Pseudomonas typographi]MBD1552613.1 ABC transporter ATP-binding protein [Pseudomonas typographi]MBD1586194.1 ABC transporter ATP-binding protein [Pseudomonas typographi]MBD1597665.1 ABC transporter ATP-binding protein [Pseudomonas typographi]